MNTTPSPAKLADAAAEAVRALNHATLPVSGRSGGYVWPSDVSEVIGALHTMAARLGQALSQADRWITGQHAAGRVGLDEPGDAATTVTHLHELLDLAAVDAHLLAHSLDLAHNEASHLTGLTPPVPAP